MDKQIQGKICLLEGKKYFKISNYDCMDDFFMTITSSSDIWNFCWSKGGITAGRIDSNHAIFPYYTADKVSDSANFTGNYTSIAINKNGQIEFWEPFTAMHAVPSIQKQAEKFLIRNLYKNENGTEILFEEINTKLNLSFITGWTSSEKFGIVRSSKIINLSDDAVEISILDGCQNILPACCTSDFQNSNSILLDAYKKTDLEEKSNLALFTVSSVVSDKAEPNEGLFANTCWFSTQDKIILNTDAPSLFASMETLPDYKAFNPEKCIKGQRPSCFICKKITLQKQNEKESSEKWYQVFDTSLTLGKITELKILLENRKALVTELEADIQRCDKVMTDFIQAADGIQNTGEEITCLHHRQNVMFNIMRGGIILDEGKIQFSMHDNSSLSAEEIEVLREAARTFGKTSVPDMCNKAQEDNLGTWPQDALKARLKDPPINTGNFGNSTNTVDFEKLLSKGLRYFINEAQEHIACSHASQHIFHDEPDAQRQRHLHQEIIDHSTCLIHTFSLLFALQRYYFLAEYGNFRAKISFFLGNILYFRNKFVLLQPDECHTACSF